MMKAVGWAAALPIIVLATAPALAQPRQVPAIDSSEFHSGTFDVRAFDPLGMPGPNALMLAEENAALREAPQAWQGLEGARPMAQPGAAYPTAAAQATGLSASSASGLFSDGWSRDGFGARRP